MVKMWLFAIALMALAVAPCFAAPESLSAGHWSLGFEADRNVNVNVGYGIANMTRLIVNGAMVSPGDVELDSRQIEVTTSYSIGIALQRYLGWASNEQLAAFLGGGVAYTASAERTEDVQLGDPPGGTLQLRFDPGDVFSINGRFGLEFFPWDPVSVSGHIGVAADMHADGESVGVGSAEQPVSAGNDVSTFSALFVTFYWGGD